ncbi:hypothetical protein SAMN05444159_1316 [Bradyrhizobium lablabi]|uniref:Uncharacterized protein n=1 Tax=Bradyrhizobium lablabi TaxID=722472 RepID=A0A1M6LLR6_9BRAD|nr:hypothetical protein [Bradyrhizobium lablabi]SHJ72127.1 hypothetical protein SAMN05444159_1316 [Bradyrhizobium lablabi]
MPSTTTLPHVFALAPDDRRVAYDAAAARALDAASEASAAHNARKVDPRSVLDYRGYQTMRMVCVLLVRHHDKPASIECSRDGTVARIYLPNSKMIAQPESSADFLLCVIPKWLAQKAELMGVTPDLAGDWSEEQRETWNRLKDARFSINRKIQSPPRLTTHAISRVNTA